MDKSHPTIHFYYGSRCLMGIENSLLYRKMKMKPVLEISDRCPLRETAYHCLINTLPPEQLI
jgi:hypothetical protein